MPFAPDTALTNARLAADAAITYFDDRTRASAILDDMTSGTAWAETPPVERDLPGVALLHARLGQRDEALRLLDEAAAAGLDASVEARAAVLGWIAIAEGRHADAVVALARARQGQA